MRFLPRTLAQRHFTLASRHRKVSRMKGNADSAFPAMLAPATFEGRVYDSGI